MTQKKMDRQDFRAKLQGAIDVLFAGDPEQQATGALGKLLGISQTQDLATAIRIGPSLCDRHGPYDWLWSQCPVCRKEEAEATIRADERAKVEAEIYAKIPVAQIP